MTCRCGNEFCWLCLGPWSEHGSSTGGYYACNKYNDNQKKGIYKKEEEEKQKMLQDLGKYEHYTERYGEHRRSLEFAVQKRINMLNLAKRLMETVDSINPRDVDFLYDAADLVVEARSAVCHSYAYGYFLNSYRKREFFEMLQGELERSLDLLDERTDGENIDRFISFASNKKALLNQEFYSHRTVTLGIINAVRNQFMHCLHSIEAGLPEVSVNEDEEQRSFMNLVKTYGGANGEWMCGMCTFLNTEDNTECEMCATPRPS